MPSTCSPNLRRLQGKRSFRAGRPRLKGVVMAAVLWAKDDFNCFRLDFFSSLFSCVLLRLDDHAGDVYVSLGCMDSLKMVDNSDFGRPSNFNR